MTVKINYLKTTGKKANANPVLFVNEKFGTNNIKKYLSKSELSYINDLLKTCDLKKNLFIFELSSKKKIVLISIKNDFKISDIENLGAEFYNCINKIKNNEYFIISESIFTKQNIFLCHFYMASN